MPYIWLMMIKIHHLYVGIADLTLVTIVPVTVTTFQGGHPLAVTVPRMSFQPLKAITVQFRGQPPKCKPGEDL